MRLKAGTWHISVSALGYNQYNSSISLKSGTIIAVELIPTEATRLGEVVVTAKEPKGMTSASLIDGTAMEHLQPSSFTDLAPLPADKDFINPERIKNQSRSILSTMPTTCKNVWSKAAYNQNIFTNQSMNLEDAFTGLTGKY